MQRATRQWCKTSLNAPGSAAKAFVLAETDVSAQLLLPIVFCESEINSIDARCFVFGADQKVVRLDVAVQKVLRVDVFNSRNKHFSQLHHSLDTKLSPAVIEKVFKGWAKQVHDHDIEITFHAIVLHRRNAEAAVQS